MRLETFLLKSLKKFGSKYTYPNISNLFKNNKVKINIICPEHGNFWQSPSIHINGHGCPLCAKHETIKKKSITSEIYFKKVKEKHNNKYDYSKSLFKSLKEKITIVCPAHGDFVQTANIHLKNGCIKCRDDSYRMTLKSFLEKANKKHNYIYNYSLITSYKNNKQKIKIICNIHGVFSLRIDNHLKGDTCPQCSYTIYNQKIFDAFVEKSNAIHNHEYDYIFSETFTKNKRVNIVCKIHEKFSQLKSNHISGSKCPTCINKNKRLSKEDFIKKAIAIHHNKYDYSQVKINLVSDKVKIICYKHGYFFQRAAPHIYAKQGCPNCSKIVSKAETEWLDYIKLPIEFRNKQVIINNRIFFPDGFDPNTNTIYEFYGDYWHGNLNVYKPEAFNKLNKMKFIDLYNRTLERENFIKNNGYKIISIWESEWNLNKSEQISNEKF